MSSTAMPMQDATFEEVALWLGDVLGEGGKCDAKGHAARTRLRHFHSRPTEKSADQFLQDLSEAGNTISANRHLARSLRTELRLFLSAWEHLMQQGLPSGGCAVQTYWALASRFLAPWAALRLAHYRRRAHKLPQWLSARMANPARGSCFSFWVEEQLRQPRRSLAKWLETTSHNSSVEVDSLRKALGQSKARRSALSDFILGGLLAGHHDQPHVCQEMILANAVDHTLLRAIQTFGKESTDHLLTFFGVCLKRFDGILSQADAPAREKHLLLWLGSPTITGNTPFDAEWLYPVVSDAFLWELARKVTQDVSLLDGDNCLWKLPTKAHGRAVWPRLRTLHLPLDLERALGSRDPMQVVTLSRQRFSQRRGQVREMRLVSRWLVVLVRSCGGNLPESVHQEVWEESDRLWRLVLQRSKGAQRRASASELLRHLLQPDRPWYSHDAAQARSLLDELRLQHRRQGQQRYLEGCLWLRLKERKQAVNALGEALSYGRSSVGSDWFPLLHQGLKASQGISRQAQGRFRKLAIVEGLVGNSRSPKTRAFMRGLEGIRQPTPLRPRPNKPVSLRASILSEARSMERVGELGIGPMEPTIRCPRVDQ